MKVSARKVFGVGLSRTGTTSLTLALQILGYRCIHWPHDPTTRQELQSYYSGAAPSFRLSIAEKSDALTDTPSASVYRELAARYPDSRFVLTVREEAAWIGACDRFFSNVIENAYANWPHGPSVEYCQAVNRRIYGSIHFDAEVFLAAYTRHNADVVRYFSPHPDRLLVMDICSGQGWEQLCPFLGCSCPPVRFPHANDFIAADDQLRSIIGHQTLSKVTL
jgi:hypothetical protein